MYKCVLWGMGVESGNMIKAIKYDELCGNLKVLGITSEITSYKAYLGYPYIHKEDLTRTAFDIILVLGGRKTFYSIQREAVEMGIKEEYIIPYSVLLKEGTSIERYIALKSNPPTIISNNCWGAYTYQTLYLKYTSPFIYTYIMDDVHYIKLLQKPEYYMEQSISYKKNGYNFGENKEYPIYDCGDIELHFFHATNRDDVIECWERRKRRIDWDNLFVMMYTESYQIADAFSQLPYKKKICFVPFESKLSGVYTIPDRIRQAYSDVFFWTMLNRMALGRILYYDAVDLLHDGVIRCIGEL